MGKAFGHIDTVIGLPANLFYSTGIPVCILVLKKCKKPDNVLFINASGPEHFEKGKRQNQLKPGHIGKIIETYQSRDDVPRYSRKVEMAEIEKAIEPAKDKHNAFLKELGLKPLP